MATWPSTLPCQPMSGSLQFTPEVNVIEFKPDIGAPIRRRRYTGRRILYNAEMKLNASQVADLDDFFKVDCGDGALPFEMADWKTGVTGTFSWVSPPNITRVSPNHWNAGIQIALEPLGEVT